MAEEPEAPTAVADAPPEPPGGLDVALDLVGLRLDDLEGGSVGRIDGVLKDAGEEAPTWLVVKVGRFGKRAAVPFDYVAAGAGHVWTPFGKATIKAACELDPSLGLNVADERALAMHYGAPEGSGRLAAVADRDEEDTGSVPA